MPRLYLNFAKNASVAKVGKLAGIIGTITNVLSLGSTAYDSFSTDNYEIDDLVYEIGGSLKSQTSDGVIQKYSFLKNSVNRLIKDGKLSYKYINGKIKITQLADNDKNNLVEGIMGIDALNIKAGKENERNYFSNYPDKRSAYEILKSNSEQNK